MLSRRRFLQLVASSIVALAARPKEVFASTGNIDGEQIQFTSEIAQELADKYIKGLLGYSYTPSDPIPFVDVDGSPLGYIVPVVTSNRAAGYLVLDASDDVLVSRYKETRRLPPLAHTGRLLDGIQEERAILSRTKNISNIIIDTSRLTTKELKAKLVDKFGDNQTRTFSIEVMSFGFKYGIPIDADIVMDVRFLPNPFYIPQLKPFTGLDRRVFDYVMSKKETKKFYAKFLDMLETAIPGYIAEGKEKLTIAIGCTGGQHRSVSIARQLAVDLAKKYPVDISHREISRYIGQ